MRFHRHPGRPLWRLCPYLCSASIYVSFASDFTKLATDDGQALLKEDFARRCFSVEFIIGFFEIHLDNPLGACRGASSSLAVWVSQSSVNNASVMVS